MYHFADCPILLCPTAAECLLDMPHNPLLGPEELPGQSYDAVRQCQLAFGPEYTVCPGMDVCARLWCAIIRKGQMVCLTKKLPAAEGTPCGKGRICLHGKCMDKTRKRHYSVGLEQSMMDWGKKFWLSRKITSVLIKQSSFKVYGRYRNPVLRG